LEALNHSAHSTARGLSTEPRKLCLTRLAEVGCTVFEIMSISGHKNVEEVQKYVDAANRKKLAVAALGKLQAGQLANA
jgi:hypothetical protein